MAALVVVVILIAIALVAGILTYLRRRLVRDAFAPGRQRRIAGAVLFGTVAAMFGTIAASRLLPSGPTERLSVVGYVLLAVFFYLALTIAVLELPRWLLHRRADRGGDQVPTVDDAPDSEPVRVDADRRRVIARALAGTAGAVALGTTTYGFVQARTIRVRRVTVPMPRADPAVDGLRIVVLTDIHLTVGLRDDAWMADVVETANALDADLVAIVGDLVDGDVDALGDDAEPLRHLRSRLGTVFVTGNHEYISGAQQWVDFLPTLGMTVLRNEHLELDRNGGTFVLAGVDDVTGEDDGAGPDIAKALDGRRSDQTAILLAHQPVLFDEARDHGVDLQISGHTHGGQMWPIHYLVRLQQGHVAGLERRGDAVLYTSRGTGSWGPPVRVGAPPEIAVLTLRAT